jgi:Mg-chelatase subunit ChlD
MSASNIPNEWYSSVQGQNTNIRLPDEWYCPITMEIMTNPVIGSDGHTYEKTAIEQWLSVHNVSPLTKAPMNKSQLVPNIALRNTIQEFTGPKPSKKTVVAPYVPTEEKVTSSYKVSKLEDGNYMIHLQVIPPKDGKRKPSVIICVIDVSGSMGSGVSTGQEEHGFSRLDLVKHSMKTMISMLDDNDYLAIIPFTTNARVLLPITQMNTHGRNSALLTVDTLRPEANTNIWDGLRLAVNLSAEEICKDKNVYSVLLTDGEPNVNPPRGIVPTLSKHIKDTPFKGTISTFGFGYNLDSNLLDEIATCCDGTYAFIPDATMVGTIFTNYISNCLACMHDTQKVGIETNGSIVETFGSTNIGMLQYGQTRDIIFKVKPSADFSFKYTINGDTTTVDFADGASTIDNETKVQLARFYLIRNLQFAINKPIAQAQALVLDTLTKLQEVNFDSRIVEMIKDIHSTNANEAQITKAFSREDWFTKWGRHYIPSVIKAHAYQQCNNFKDCGVQIYGGALFHSIRDIADEVFCKLPPPEPSIKSYASTHTAQPASMSSYYDPTGGCFGGNSQVHMQGGIYKLVSQVHRGDVLSNGARVVCVVKTIVTKGQKPMVNVNGLAITNWHPVLINNEWVFPVEQFGSRVVDIEMVYNFVLDRHHIITINDIECCTLGHGFTDNDVISHPYYGTNKIIDDLRKMNGWNQGEIIIQDDQFVREGNRVSGLMV